MILQDWNTIRYPLSTLECVIFLLYNFVNISMYNTNGFLLYNMFVSHKNTWCSLACKCAWFWDVGW
jgi:hypothetical protein